jgi:hypothetical protein
MSRQLALDTIHLRPTPRLAHTEYSMEYHHAYMATRTGLPESAPDLAASFRADWGYDMLWSTDDGLHKDWGARGRVSNMGHAEYAGDGSDFRSAGDCPFKRADDVWAFDAVAEYGLPDFDEQVAAYEAVTHAARTGTPDQLITGGYYHTIISGAIAAFGWEMLLLAAADRGRMEQVLDSFFRFTRFHMEAWAQTSMEVVIQHDDFVWTEGPFMNPAVYREDIIPRYAELWKPLHAAGKKVLFCSDGDFTMFAEDIVAAGADGLIFEPCMDFDTMADRFGASTVLVGSHVDCRDMSFRDWPTVRAAMDRTFARVPDCRGLIFAVGNHIPANVPDEMLDHYITYLQENWAR